MRAALVHASSGKIVNLVELPDGYDPAAEGAYSPPPGHRVELDADGEAVTGGYFTDGAWVAPAGDPRLELPVDAGLVGNGTDSVLVAYVHPGPGAPASVVFTVNGAQSPPVPLVDGRAELALSAAAPGRVRLEVAGLAATLTAT